MKNLEQEISTGQQEVHIDVTLIPEQTRDALARATLDFVRSILARPGGREDLDKTIAELGLR